MRIVTWNVNSITARLERVLRYLDRERPDVLCLQELKCLDEHFPESAFRERGYDVATFGQKSYNGVAIASRTPLRDVRRGFDDGDADRSARFIGATVGDWRVYCAYVPNGEAVGSEKYAFKLRWYERLEAFFARTHRPTDDVILCGDFNVAPDDRDVHDPDAWRERILCSTPERAALAKVLAWGFRDTLRKHVSDGGVFSWWDYRNLGFPKNRGLRIDFVLATDTPYGRCTAARVIRDERKGQKPSDHAPVEATFD